MGLEWGIGTGIMSQVVLILPVNCVQKASPICLHITVIQILFFGTPCPGQLKPVPLGGAISMLEKFRDFTLPLASTKCPLTFTVTHALPTTPLPKPTAPQRSP